MPTIHPAVLIAAACAGTYAVIVSRRPHTHPAPELPPNLLTLPPHLDLEHHVPPPLEDGAILRPRGPGGKGGEGGKGSED
jgi:hypothetical protein